MSTTKVKLKKKLHVLYIKCKKKMLSVNIHKFNDIKKIWFE